MDVCKRTLKEVITIYNLTLITAPTTEPIDIMDAIDYLKISKECIESSEELYIASLITAARKFCENYQNRAYITQTWELSHDYWPSENIIEIPKGNLQSITSIKYKDSSGAETIISPSDYVLSTRSILGRVCPAYDKSWPSFTPYPLDAIVIRFVCGYGATSASVPETVKQAMYLLISHWYENRLPLADKMTIPDELNFSVSALLWQERIVIL